MFVGLYTSRVVLQTLGVADFGIYNVVGGIVTMCVFISNTLSSASQRFFAFEIGRNDTVQLRKVFSASLFIYVAFVLVILILAETVGRWFVENKLNIPPSREAAAYFVYHFSVLSFLSSIIRVPYNALIIARGTDGLLRLDQHCRGCLEVIDRLPVGLVKFRQTEIVCGFNVFCRIPDNPDLCGLLQD